MSTTIMSNRQPFFERPDLTPYLVHLTKNTVAKDEYSAYENLLNILRTGKIWGSGSKGYVRGPNKAACFMDIPFASLKYILNADNCDQDTPRYEPYGIVVTKRFAYDQGCRPVLYLSNEEIDALDFDESELWRVVRFEGVGDKVVSWVHEREWRCKDRFSLPKSFAAVLVRDLQYAQKLRKELQENPRDYAAVPKSILPIEVICQGLPYLE